MFKCSVQEGWQNRNRLALGICFVQPRRAHQILFDVCGEVHPSAPMVTPNAWPMEVPEGHPQTRSHLAQFDTVGFRAIFA